MAQLPHAQLATVAQDKIVNYLLARRHPAGGPKAAFFERFGFTTGNWQRLADALTQHARSATVVVVSDTPFGRKYVIDGALPAPDGRQPDVRAIWFIATGETIPRFVTAYPVRGAWR